MANPILLDPKKLGFWIKCLRETQKWSQEALAVAAGIEVRTVQRVESGEKASVTTRRAIARAFGYEKPDIFDDREFVKSILEFFEIIEKTNREAAMAEFKKLYPDHVRIKVSRLKGGGDLLKMVEDGNGIQADISTELSEEAQQDGARLLDYLRDCLDILGEVTFSDKLMFGREVDRIMVDLERTGAVVYAGMRTMRLTNDNWENKEPLLMRMLIATIVPAGKELTEVAVPRAVSFG